MLRRRWGGIQQMMGQLVPTGTSGYEPVEIRSTTGYDEREA